MGRSDRTGRAGVAAVLLAAALVAGCSGSGGVIGGGNGPPPSDGGGGGGGGSPLTGFFRGTPQSQVPITEQLPQGLVCPRVRIQPETEVLRREAGAADAKRLSWQASITKTARECQRSGAEGVQIRLGLAGRVVQGPAGASGRLDLPLRIAVRQGGQVVSSNVRNVSVTLGGPSEDWAYVEESIVLDTPRGAEILVGFDS